MIYISFKKLLTKELPEQRRSFDLSGCSELLEHY